MASTEKTAHETEKELPADTTVQPAGTSAHEHKATAFKEAAEPKRQKYNLSVSRSALVAVAVVVGLGLSFLAGVQYQKGHTETTVNGLPVSANGEMAGPGGMGMGGRYGARMGGVGTVTAVSSSSITITQRSFGPDSSSSGTSKTYTIDDSTKITVDGSTASASDIKTGDTVFIRTSGSSSTLATQISVGDMPGPGANTQSDTGSGTTDSTDTSTI